MVKSKIYVGLLALAAVVMLLLVGCGGTTPQPTPKPTPQGTLYVSVADNSSKMPIGGATVSFSGRTGITNKDGNVEFRDVKFGTYYISATKEGYIGNKISVKMDKDPAYATIYLDPIQTNPPTPVDRGTLKVTVRSSNETISEATVTIESIKSAEVPYSGRAISNKDGVAEFTNVPFGQYNITATKKDYSENSILVTFNKDGQSTQILITPKWQTP